MRRFNLSSFITGVVVGLVLASCWILLVREPFVFQERVQRTYELNQLRQELEKAKAAKRDP